MMIRVNIDEDFPITVTLFDEDTGEASTGKTVYYDVRTQPGDTQLTPAVDGSLSESSVTPGVYKTYVSLPLSGSYVIYATCSGFIPSSEEVLVEEENIYELVKQCRHHNISVENVLRLDETPTASQITRKVPYGKTDYTRIKIKRDSDTDWSGSEVTEELVYAWYDSVTSIVPYKMGDAE